MATPSAPEPPLLNYATPAEGASVRDQVGAVRNLRVFGVACAVVGLPCFGMEVFSQGLPAYFAGPDFFFAAMFLLLGVGGCVHVVCSVKMDRGSGMAALLALVLAALQESAILLSLGGEIYDGVTHTAPWSLAPLLIFLCLPALWIADVLVDLLRFLRPAGH